MKKYKVTYTSINGVKNSETFNTQKEAKKKVDLGMKFIESFGGKMEYETFNVTENEQK